MKLHSECMGAATLVLALVALMGRRTTRTWFFAGLALVALLFAWGGATPIHRLFYWTLPVMKSFRAPGMMYSVVALAAVVLAGLGAQTLHDRRDMLRSFRHPAWRVAGGLGILLVLLWFWAAGSPGGFGRALGGILYGSMEPARAAALERAMPGFARSLGLFTLWWWASLVVCWAAVREKLGLTPACFLLAGIEVRPQPADSAHDDRVVEEDVGQQDCRERLLPPERAERAVLLEQASERRAHDHGGEHERHRDRRPQKPAAGKVVAGEHVRAGQRHEHGQHRRQRQTVLNDLGKARGQRARLRGWPVCPARSSLPDRVRRTCGP